MAKDARWKLPAGERPQRPIRFAVTAGRAFHHIIPYPILRECWNAAVDADPQVALRLLRWADPPDVNGAIKRFSQNEVPDLPRLTIIQQALAWPVWNLVEGPVERSDDPRDKLDKFDDFKDCAGLLPRERRWLQRLRGVHDAMAGFSKNQPGDLNLIHLLDGYHPSAAIAYRKEIWVRGGDGGFKKSWR